MVWQAVRRATLLIPSGPAQDPLRKHLLPGEHPFVSEHSYVAYKFASLQDPANLQAKVNAHQFVAKPILSEKAFSYVVAGLQDSPYAEPYLLKFFAAATRPF